MSLCDLKELLLVLHEVGTVNQADSTEVGVHYRQLGHLLDSNTPVSVPIVTTSPSFRKESSKVGRLIPCRPKICRHAECKQAIADSPAFLPDIQASNLIVSEDTVLKDEDAVSPALAEVHILEQYPACHLQITSTWLLD